MKLTPISEEEEEEGDVDDDYDDDDVQWFNVHLKAD